MLYIISFVFVSYLVLRQPLGLKYAEAIKQTRHKDFESYKHPCVD